MNKSTQISIAVIIVILIGAWFYFNNNPAAAGLKVGAILPLTGEFAFIGEEMQRGMELALADYPDVGIKIIYEDDQVFDPKTAVNALNKLINVDKVLVVLNDVVNTIKAEGPILNEKKVPGIVVWDSNKEIFGLGDYTFSIGLSTEEAGKDMAKFAFEKLAIKNLSIVSAHDHWSEIISSAFEKEFKNIGGTIDLHEVVNINQSDLRINISKIKSAGSKAIYFPLYSQSLNSLIKQSRELGFTGYLLTGDSITDNDIKNLGTYIEGIYLTQAWLEDKSFFKKYKEKYEEERNPVSLAFAALGYDSVKMLAELFRVMEEKDIGINSQNIRDGLVGFEFDGVSGHTNISADRTADKLESILTVKNGQFELVK